MRILSAFTACACLCLVAAGASGQTYSSDQYGFTAEYPAEPAVGVSQGGETGAKGKFISNSVIIQARVLGVWTAMVTVESYTVPRKIDAGSTLAAMPKLFASQLDATLTSSKPGKVDGYKARFFTYQTRDKATMGNGIAIVVPSAKPRTYLVLTSRTSIASDQNVADLDKFIASFHLK
jgi:hypothetical protein